MSHKVQDTGKRWWELQSWKQEAVTERRKDWAKTSSSLSAGQLVSDYTCISRLPQQGREERSLLPQPHPTHYCVCLEYFLSERTVLVIADEVWNLSWHTCRNFVLGPFFTRTWNKSKLGKYWALKTHSKIVGPTRFHYFTNFRFKFSSIQDMKLFLSVA